VEPVRITISVYCKNPKLPNPSYYARVRQNGKTKDIHLHTKDRSVAEAWVKLRRKEVEQYNAYVTCGEEPPAGLLSKLEIAQKGTSKAVLTLTKAIDEFELDCRRRGLRERTVMAYVRNLRQLVPIDANYADFTRDNVLKWLAKYDQLKSATRKFYSISLRELAKFLVARYDLDPRILTNWVRVKVESAEKGYWTMTQIYHIIEAVRSQNIYCEAQFKVFCWVMAVCGSRQNETGLLKWSDYRDGTLTFRAENTKTHKTRVVPLDIRVCHMLDRLPHRGDLIFSDIPPSQPGRFAILSKAIARSGMPKGGLHTFRHSCSMACYKNSDIKAVSQMLGHSPATALKYYQASRQADELKQVVEQTFANEIMIPSPMDELIKNGLW